MFRPRRPDRPKGPDQQDGVARSERSSRPARSARPDRSQRKARPLKAEALSELALAYVSRFATSQAKLTRYLNRKLAERGWEGEGLPDVERLVASMVGYGYVNDAAFAEIKARSLTRRGYGKRRVDAAIYEAGIAEPDRAAADEVVETTRTSAALRLAERRRWGPYAQTRETDPAKRQKMIGTFLRAGHDHRLARRILEMAPGDDPAMLEE